MKATELTNANSDELNDEVSILDLIRELWAGRGVIVGGVIVSLILGAGLALLNASRVNAVTEYFISIQVLNDGEYPNGTEFSPQDIIAPEVLSRLASQIGGIDVGSLRENLSVEFGAPLTAGIIDKYRRRLSARNLSAAEINRLNSSFQAELESATASSVRISLNHVVMGIGSETARDILTALPSVWSEVHTDTFRIFEDPRLPVTLVKLGPSVKTVQGQIYADQTLETMLLGLKIIINDNRLVGLQTEQGNTAFNLERRANDLSDLYLGPLLSVARATDAAAEIYVQKYMLLEDAMEIELTNVKDTISQIQAIMTRRDVGGSSNMQDGNQLQIDSCALDTIVSLTNQVSLTAYLTPWFDKQSTMVSEQASLRKKILRMTTSLSTNTNFISTLGAQTQSEFEQLLGEYNDLLTSALETVENQGNALYLPIGSPVDISDDWLRAGTILIAASGFLGLALSLFAVFALSIRRKLA